MWIDGPVFLPLIILGVEYLIDDGRKINYIIPTALMFVANFYIGFMIAIFIAIYFFYYLFFGTSRKFKNIGEYGMVVLRMGISTLVVLMCSFIMIMPVYNALALGKKLELFNVYAAEECFFTDFFNIVSYNDLFHICTAAES